MLPLMQGHELKQKVLFVCHKLSLLPLMQGHELKHIQLKSPSTAAVLPLMQGHELKQICNVIIYIFHIAAPHAGA